MILASEKANGDGTGDPDSETETETEREREREREGGRVGGEEKRGIPRNRMAVAGTPIFLVSGHSPFFFFDTFHKIVVVLYPGVEFAPLVPR